LILNRGEWIRTNDLLLPSSNRGFGVQRFQHVTSDKAGQNRLEGGNRGNQWQPKKVTQRATQNPIPGDACIYEAYFAGRI
jgi:hypothetical protein